MVSRLFSSAGSFLQSVTEVIAPTVQSDLELFKSHWKEIVKFYVDQRDDLEASDVPVHLNEMLRLLIEEAAENRDPEYSEQTLSTGPCLEFFLKNKILEGLCNFAIQDQPPGMKKLVICLVVAMLRNMKASILPHMSVHQPISFLVRTLYLQFHQDENKYPKNSAYYKARAGERKEYIALVGILVEKLNANPHLVGFFIYSELGQPYFPLFLSLLDYTRERSEEGARSRDAIVSCVRGCSVETATYIINYSNLCSKTVDELVGAYRSLPSDFKYQSQNLVLVEEFMFLLRFSVSIVKVARKEISAQFMQIFEDRFVNKTLGPALLQSNENDAIAATIYLRDYILPEARTCDILFNAFLSFIIGDCSGFSNMYDDTDNPILTTLTRRIDSVSERMSICSLKFFDWLLSLNKKRVTYQLITKNLIPFAGEIENRRLGEEEIKQLILSYMVLFSKNPAIAPNTSEYETYFDDAKTFYLHTRTEWAADTTFQPPNFGVSASSMGGSSCESLLVKTVLNKLENAVSNSWEVNLYTTSIISKLCLIPDHLISNFFLEYRPDLLKTRFRGLAPRSLHSILIVLAGESDRYAQQTVGFRELLDRASNELQTFTSIPPPVAPEYKDPVYLQHRRVLQAIIALNEFSKEVASIIQAKDLLN